MSGNGLKPIKIKTKTKYYDNITKLQDILDIIGNDSYDFVLYHFSYVSFGKIVNGNILHYDNLSIPDDLSNIIKLRIFNENSELLVFNSNDKLKARLRIDNNNDGGETDVIEAEQITYGTWNVDSKNPDFDLIYEESGNQFYIPKLDFNLNTKKR